MSPSVPYKPKELTLLLSQKAFLSPCFWLMSWVYAGPAVPGVWQTSTRVTPHRSPLCGIHAPLCECEWDLWPITRVMGLSFLRLCHTNHVRPVLVDRSRDPSFWFDEVKCPCWGSSLGRELWVASRSWGPPKRSQGPQFHNSKKTESANNLTELRNRPWSSLAWR